FMGPGFRRDDYPGSGAAVAGDIVDALRRYVVEQRDDATAAVFDHRQVRLPDPAPPRRAAADVDSGHDARSTGVLPQRIRAGIGGERAGALGQPYPVLDPIHDRLLLGRTDGCGRRRALTGLRRRLRTVQGEEQEEKLDGLHDPGLSSRLAARLNEEVQIGDLRVKPLAVVEDNRCPEDVACVVAGRILLRVAVSGAGEPVMEMNQPVTVAGGQRLTLVGVAPPNWARPPEG